MVKSNVTTMAKRRTVRVDAERWERMQEILRQWKAEKHETARVRERAAYVEGMLRGMRNRSR